MNDDNNMLASLEEIYRDAALHVDDKLSRGVIYRGPCPAYYQDAGDINKYFLKKNISLRLDLRGEEEKLRHPIKEGMTIPANWLPIDPYTYVSYGLPESYYESIDIIRKAYEGIVLNELEVFKNVVDAIISNPDATLIHCTAGRDRTGIVLPRQLNMAISVIL